MNRAQAVICDNEDCDLFDQTQDGEGDIEKDEVRCEDCGNVLGSWVMLRATS